MAKIKTTQEVQILELKVPEATQAIESVKFIVLC